jgi:hypothetical protein
MTETRSLWEVYDSETEAWRRGRIILIYVGLFHFVFQVLVVAAQVIIGNLDRVLTFGVIIVFFWLLFYFVWIGVHWIRWLWGGWNLTAGFCLLIWAWRDESGLETLGGTISFLVGAYLCSPSVYFFANRQKEIVRWRESLLFGAVCVLMVCSIAAASFALWEFGEQRREDACDFADQAAWHIYADHDRNWTLSNVTQLSLQQGGPARLGYFLEDTRKRLGSMRQILAATGTARLHFQLPFRFEVEAHVISHAETQFGPAELHFLLWNHGDHWEIEHMWWEYLPIPEGSPVPTP